jgi:hypothetical protein
MKKLILPLLLLSSPALAEPFTFGPDDCEFQTTFPEKPFIEKKCSQNSADCTVVTTFTKAVGTSASTNFRVTCNPLDANEAEKYTPKIIEETLKKLVQSNNLIIYDIQSSKNDTYKSASAISVSQRDEKALVYNAQIWVGKKSIFTIEGEMIGDGNEVIQETFANILRNTYAKDRKPNAIEKSDIQPSQEKTAN